MATKTAFPLLALLLAVVAGCSPDGGQAEPRVAPDVAAGLAARAERVAAALDAGQCDQALAGARSLQNDLAALPAEPALKAEALAGTARLVSGISCPVAAPPPVPVVTVPDSTITARGGNGRKGKGHKGDDDDD